MNLAHNGVFVVDQPTEYDPHALTALVRAAEEHYSPR